MITKYIQRQAEILDGRASKIAHRGHLEDYRDLYPEIELEGQSVSYSRRSMNLILPMLLYDKVAFLVPPMPGDWFEQNLGISLADFERLVEAQLIQPLIAEPKKYDTTELGFLLERDTPSVLARGKQALKTLELENLLDPKASSLPLKEMAQIPELRKRVVGTDSGKSKASITKSVIEDILVNYADLVVFGHADVAEAILSYEDPRAISRALYDFSEALAYPQLFGFGGAVNYSPSNLLSEAPPVMSPHAAQEFRFAELEDRDLEIFLKGIDVSVGKFDAKTLIEFHEDGQALKLRSAMKHFEEQARLQRNGLGNAPLEEAELVKTSLLEASNQLLSPRIRRGLRKVEEETQFYLQIGGIALASVTGTLLALSSNSLVGGALVAAGAGTAATKVIIPRIQDAVQAEAVKKLTNPGLANLWTVRNRK